MNSSSPQVVCFGEVLWDLLPNKALPGGAPANVAYHVKKMGCQPALITKIGLDEYGKSLVNLLSEAGVCTEYIDVDYEQPTGLVYARPNANHEVSYDIVNPSAWDFIGWKDEYQNLVKAAGYFVYGSLSSRNRVSRNTLYQLLEIANTKVLDINLRTPHFNRTAIEALLGKADILKMNLDELELVTGWFSHYKDARERIEILQQRFRISTIIVTMGGDGALVNHEWKFYRQPGFAVPVSDTIGSGDSFLAAFLSQTIKGQPVEKALEFASATGAFIATQQGACPAYEISKIEELIATASATTAHTISNV